MIFRDVKFYDMYLGESFSFSLVFNGPFQAEKSCIRSSEKNISYDFLDELV